MITFSDTPIVQSSNSQNLVSSKLALLTQRMQKGFSMEFFYTQGVGLQSVLAHVGRLSDFKGVFVIVDDMRKPIIVGESKHVIQEILKLAKSTRVKDQELLKEIALRYGLQTSLAGLEHLKSMEVNWLEVTSKTERLMLKRAMTSKSVFTI